MTTGWSGGTVADVTAALDLSGYSRLAARDHGLAVVSTSRSDGTVQSSLVNAGVLDHPVSGEPVLGVVVRPDARKLVNLRARPWTTLVVRAGYEWVAVEGSPEIVAPEDPASGFDDEGLRRLLRDVFVAAGGSHDDWAEFDRVM